ncbi:MAG: hypothetical protein ACXWDU_06055 [Actinomycetota bacterium]
MFGTLTRVLAAIFVISGLGAGYAALTAGDQMTAGHGGDRLILTALAIGYGVIGAGLWVESVWAWWAGAAVTIVTVVMSRALDTPEAGWIVWLIFFILFAITGVQGRRAHREPPPPNGPTS